MTVMLEKRNKKLVCIGFSVLEDKFGPKCPLMEWGNKNGFEILCFGFGGLHIEQFPFLIDLVSNHTDLRDAIVFMDIQTSGVRSYFKAENYHSYMQEIFRRLAALRCRPVFLHFFRKDVDPQNDFLIQYIDRYAEQENIPVLNLAIGLYSLFAAGVAKVDDYFRDVVHTNYYSSKYYSDEITRFFVEADIPVYSKTSFGGGQKMFTLPVNELSKVCLEFSLTRHGLPVHFVKVDEDKPVVLEFKDSPYVLGIFLVFGPGSGFLRMSSGDTYVKEVVCFDEASYYDRLSYRFVAAEKVSIRPKSCLLIAELSGHQFDRGEF